jgi:hypothetical protein
LLIPFKAKAYLDLTKRKADGEQISDKQINNHRNDVFRLAQLLPADLRVDIPEPIRNDFREFLNAVRDDEAFDPHSFDVAFSRADGIALLECVYAIAQ